MNSALLIIIVSALAAFFLVGLIVIHGKNKRINQYFILMTIAIISWVISNYLSNFVKNYQYALLWNKLIFVTTTIAAWAFLIFSEIFPNEHKPLEKKLFWISFSLMVIVIFISLSPYLVKEIIIKENISEIIFDRGIYLYIVFLVGCLLFAFVKLIVKYLKSKDVLVRKSIRLFGIGMGIFLAFSLGTNLLLPILFKKFELTNLVPVYTSLFLLSVAISILRYGFLEIKVILTEFLVGAIGLIILVQALTAEILWWKIFGFILLCLFSIMGYYLIRYTYLEIQRRQEIEKIDKAKSEFISIASHQLRTPLTAVKGYISMIMEGIYGQLPEKMQQPLQNVYQSNERLIKLVNDLLNLSRLDAGKIEFNPQPTSLEELVFGIVEELKINAEKKGLYIKVIKPSEVLPKIMVDQDKIRQVILNIVDNAIKYTKEGGITIELKKINEKEEVKISDTGMGMEKSEVESLFQMFSRATAGTQLHTEGAGIGLYVARQFVEMHGGKIWAESPGKGKGSTFFVQLPIKLEPKLLKEKTKTVVKAPDAIF